MKVFQNTQNISTIYYTCFSECYLIRASGLKQNPRLKYKWMDSAATPHIELIEDENFPSSATSISMKNAYNASDEFALVSWLHPGANKIIGWTYNGAFQLAWNETLGGLGVGVAKPI